MFANSYQSGCISIFYSCGSNPLSIWDKQVKNGHIRRVVDEDVKSLVLEIAGTNVATTYITCPIKPKASLGIKLPFLVMVIKNMKKYFTFEIQILDDKDMHRRFRVSNFQSTTKVKPFCTTMPIGLSNGWNQVQFNLADFTRRAYGSTYVETTRVQIHANVRIRRIYMSDTLYSEEDMPNEFKLFAPTTPQKKAAVVKGAKEGKRVSKDIPKLDLVEKTSEVPPPPTPVEEESPRLEDESPVAAETEPESPAVDQVEPEAPAGEIIEGEGELPPIAEVTEAAAEGEAPVAAEGEEIPIVEPEAEAVHVEGEQAAPVEAAEEVPAEAVEGEAPPPVLETLVEEEGEVKVEEEVPVVVEEAPVVEEVEAPVELEETARTEVETVTETATTEEVATTDEPATTGRTDETEESLELPPESP